MLLNEKLRDKANLTIENINDIMNLINQVSAKASDLPKILKSLDEARENLMYEKETETARGGTAVSSSMDASQY